MSALNGIEKEYNIKYLKDLEMTKAERLRRIEYSDKDIQMELDFLANNLICDKEMKLKIGSQVMCIVNIQSDTGIEVCNGSQGIVTDFCEVTGCPRVKFNNGIERIMIRNLWASDKIPGIGVSQVPLILAWALTIHKSQGATMDNAEIDVGSGIFECGQTYVALSRVKSLDGLYLTSFDATKIRINKKVKEFYESIALYHNNKKDSVKTDNDKELAEETYEENNNKEILEPMNNISDTKVINFNGF
jgi:ATP-dependent DNA helicase PIF1